MIFVPEKLKKLRTSRNVSQAVLAEKLGVGRSVISAWECGIKKPSLRDMTNICVYFNAPIKEICDGTPEFIDTVVKNDIDVSKLNDKGKKELLEMYKYLLASEKFTKPNL